MGLVQYDSSDEDEDERMQIEAQPEPQVQKPENPVAKALGDDGSISPQPSAAPSVSTAIPNPTEVPQESQPTQPVTGPQLGPAPEGAVLGPALGPSRPPQLADSHTIPSAPQQPLPGPQDIDMSFLETTSDSNEHPKSPYTTRRALLRDLTLPAIDISSLEIPPSPPSSPSESSRIRLKTLNAKFDHFLLLKQAKGIHFNQQLAASSRSRNPSITDKLLGFVGIETESLGPDDVKATEQYGTTLPGDLWNPAAFPGWAYKGMLRKAQERGSKARERAKGEPVQFAAPSSAWGSNVGAGGGGSVGGLSTGVAASGLGSSSGGKGKRKTRFDS